MNDSPLFSSTGKRVIATLCAVAATFFAVGDGVDLPWSIAVYYTIHETAEKFINTVNSIWTGEVE